MRASLRTFPELARDNAPPAAQRVDAAEAMPLMLRPLLTVRDFVLGSLLGAAASCLALVAGMSLGFGKTRLAVCFTAVTVLIILYVALSPPLPQWRACTRLPPLLGQRRLLGHPLIADDYSEYASEGNGPETMRSMEEAEHRDALLA